MEDLTVEIRRLEQPADAQAAYCCMTEVPTPWPQALCQCRDWVAENLGQHVEGFHLSLAGGDVIGHLYYALSEQALIPYEVEPGVAALYCEWVQRRYQNQGLGRRLFAEFLEAMRQQEVKGILTEGTDIEGQMHFAHYQGRGFEVISESGHRKLLYLPITQPEISAKPLLPRVRPRRGIPVEILILRGFMCPYEAETQRLAREVAQEFGDQVRVQDAWLTPDTLLAYGIANGVLINGHSRLAGGETEAAIRQAILEELQHG